MGGAAGWGVGAGQIIGGPGLLAVYQPKTIMG